jgi:uncharacterized membrane protein
MIKDHSKKRHIAKTITWRIIGTIDTMILGWIISGNPMTGVKIGGLEVVTKMVLYYAHERAWFRINFGLPHRIKPDSENKEVATITTNIDKEYNNNSTNN